VGEKVLERSGWCDHSIPRRGIVSEHSVVVGVLGKDSSQVIGNGSFQLAGVHPLAALAPSGPWLTGASCPNMTFSVTPVRLSNREKVAALWKISTVSSKEARNRTSRNFRFIRITGGNYYLQIFLINMNKSIIK
jgi:hypothetical protein